MRRRPCAASASASTPTRTREPRSALTWPVRTWRVGAATASPATSSRFSPSPTRRRSMAEPTEQPGKCDVCATPMEDYEPEIHTVCGLRCAVTGNVVIDGMEDAEIVAAFIEEIVEDEKVTSSPAALQAEIARLLRWTLRGERDPVAQSLNDVLSAFIQIR